MKGQKKVNIRGIISKHAENNVYSGIKIPSLGIVCAESQIEDDPRIGYIGVIDENNFAGPTISGMPDHVSLQKEIPAHIALFYAGMTNAIP